MDRVGFIFLGLLMTTCTALGQTSEKPASATEALALATIIKEENITPHREFQMRVGSLLVEEKFDALEVIANEVRESKERWGFGRWKLETFYHGCETGRGVKTPRSQPIPYIERVERWIAAYPNSITAKIAMSRVRMELAWKARGGGWASEVKEEGWAGMNRHLNAAWKVLEEAEALQTPDPELYCEFIRAGKLLNKPSSELRAIYEKGIAVEAGYPPLYMALAWTMMPRWGGAPGEVESFARKAAEDSRAVPGTGAYAWILNDYRGMTATTTFIHRFEWSILHLEEAFEDILAVYPDDRWIQNIRARLSSLVEDKESAKQAFAVIGRDFDTGVWPDKWVYGRWKRWAENDAEWPGGNGLHYGVRWDEPQICRTYLDAGAAIDETDESGFTPLHYAAQLGKVNAAKFLIANGADVSDGKATMLTPLQTASSAGSVAMVELLIQHGADPMLATKLEGSTPLITAAANSRAEVIRVLLKQPSIDVNVADKKGRTAIYFAGARGQIGIIKMLLDAGADVNHRAASGQTALYWARQNKKVEAAKFLEAHGATL